MDRRLRIAAPLVVALLACTFGFASGGPCGYDQGNYGDNGSGVADANGNVVQNAQTDDDVVAAANPLAACPIDSPGGVEVCLAQALNDDPDYASCYPFGGNAILLRKLDGTPVPSMKLSEKSPEARMAWVNLEGSDVVGRIRRFKENPQGGSSIQVRVNDVVFSIPTLTTDTAYDLSLRLLYALQAEDFVASFRSVIDVEHLEFSGNYIVIDYHRDPTPQPIVSIMMRTFDPAIVTTTLVLERSGPGKGLGPGI